MVSRVYGIAAIDFIKKIFGLSKIKSVCDIDVKKQGELLEGIEIASPEKLLENFNPAEDNLLITTALFEQVVSVIKKFVIEKFGINPVNIEDKIFVYTNRFLFSREDYDHIYDLNELYEAENRNSSYIR